MVEYIIVFLVLLGVSIAFFLVYQYFMKRDKREESSLYVQALVDLLNGDDVGAFAKLRQVVAEDSSNIDAYLRLGKILREHGKPERALQVHRDLTLRSMLTSAEKVAVLRQLAEDYIALNDMDMAEAAVKELIALAPQNHWAYKKLVSILQSTGKLDDAYDAAVQLLKIEGVKSKKPLAVYKFLKGKELYQKREYHKARVLFKEALGLDPGYVEAYLAIGDSYNDEERFEDAVNFWKKLIEAVPNQGHRVIGRLKKTLFTLGRYGELADICEKILHFDAKNLEARLTLAEFHEKKGEMERAREILEQVVEDSPQSIKAIIELIRIYLDKGDRKKINNLFRHLEQRSEEQLLKDKEQEPNTSVVSAS